MRAIVRFSIDNDPGNVWGAKLQGALWHGGQGLSHTGSTRTFENSNISEQILSDVLKAFWDTAHSAISNGRKLDHFWMYAD